MKAITCSVGPFGLSGAAPQRNGSFGHMGTNMMMVQRFKFPDHHHDSSHVSEELESSAAVPSLQSHTGELYIKLLEWTAFHKDAHAGSDRPQD